MIRLIILAFFALLPQTNLMYNVIFIYLCGVCHSTGSQDLVSRLMDTFMAIHRK